jgi:hypothetical protein
VRGGAHLPRIYLEITMNKMTIAAAKAELKVLGVVLRKTDWNEFRVSVKGGSEASAYYTDDIRDAVNTGVKMGIEAMAPKNP